MLGVIVEHVDFLDGAIAALDGETDG